MKSSVGNNNYYSRFVAIVLLEILSFIPFSKYAFSQVLDCNEIKLSKIPFELRGQNINVKIGNKEEDPSQNDAARVQVYRNDGGYTVIYSGELFKRPFVKYIVRHGFVIKNIRINNSDGSQINTEVIDKNLPNVDQKILKKSFKLAFKEKMIDNKGVEFVSIIDYSAEYIMDEVIFIGPCAFDTVVYKIVSVKNIDNKEINRSESLIKYSPDLQFSLSYDRKFSTVFGYKFESKWEIKSITKTFTPFPDLF